MGDAIDRLREELARLQQAMAAQEALRGILPDEQVEAMLAPLREKAASLQVAIGGDANVVGDGSTAIKAEGDAVVADRGGVAAGQVAVGRDVYGDVILVADPDQVWRAIRRRPPGQDLRRATEHHLSCLVDRYRYLDFKGMGVSDRIPLRLPLLDMYVPLKARIELPEGETWARELFLAGREVPDEERAAIGERLSEPEPVADLLRENDGLIILGDPGAGKTTFLKYLALKLAAGRGEDLGLEVRLPVLIPLSAYASALMEKDVRLDDFVAGYFHDLGADLPVDAMLEEALKGGGALVLLDGLDEVKDPGLRRTVADRVVDFYVFHRRAGNRFVVTSRIIGYREVRPVAEGLAECTLVDFCAEEIEEFVAKWTSALEKAARGDTPVAALEARREREELLEAVHRNPGVRGLAANPLLLTILALMKRQGVTLPERRVELYDQYVSALLSSWNRARGLGRPPARDLDVVETVRILAPLALWMHRVSPGVGLVKQGDLQRKLEDIYAERGEADPERAARQFVEDVREYAGLLLERGAGRYGFIHLTFEEYLAAVGIARLGQRKIEPIVAVLAEHAADPAWREVVLLTVGYLGVVQQWEEMSSEVLKAFIARGPGEPGQALVLAGEAVVDAWPGGVTPACREKVVQGLVKALRRTDVRPALRAAAGRTLAKLGDPRPGVGTLSPPLHAGEGPGVRALPDVTWCYVPPGPFVMGDGGEQHRNETITVGYLISRYPITNAQFSAFVGAGGYGERRLWVEAERAGVWAEGKVKGRYDDEPRAGPYNYGEPVGLPNHPVVGVTWYEALAFCRWLDERLQVSGFRFQVWLGGRLETVDLEPETPTVRLPSEAECEKAARGGGKIPNPKLQTPNSKSQSSNWVENLEPGRIFPWGSGPDPDRANYGETGIGTTSAVGCFSGGASPYGVEDLSGNVWEWTRSLRRDYPYDPGDGRENLGVGGDRVLRGGAFGDSVRGVRCAYRYRGYPNYRSRFRGFRVVASPVHL